MNWKIAYILARVFLILLSFVYILFSIIFQTIWCLCGREVLVAIEWVRGGCILYNVLSIGELKLCAWYLVE